MVSKNVLLNWTDWMINQLKTWAVVPVIKKLAIVPKANRIWEKLTAQQYLLGPGVTVLAKMNSFGPWPARVNTIYKVGDVLKCYVLFYGTFQIGSVLKNQCVNIRDCDSYLLHAVDQIKQTYKWELNYDKIAESVDNERSKQITKLTQVQKFLLAIYIRTIANERQWTLKMELGDGNFSDASSVSSSTSSMSSSSKVLSNVSEIREHNSSYQCMRYRITPGTRC